LDRGSQVQQPKNTVQEISAICCILSKIEDKNRRFNYLIRIACISGHDNSPFATCSGHGGNWEAFFPLLIDPFERKYITDFVGLLSVSHPFNGEKIKVILAIYQKKKKFWKTAPKNLLGNDNKDLVIDIKLLLKTFAKKKSTACNLWRIALPI
jgi:hypothetical protein